MKSRFVLLFVLLGIIGLSAFIFWNKRPINSVVIHKTSFQKKTEIDKGDTMDNIFYNPLGKLILCVYK